jgi:hypothetical protein
LAEVKTKIEATCSNVSGFFCGLYCLLFTLNYLPQTPEGASWCRLGKSPSGDLGVGNCREAEVKTKIEATCSNVSGFLLWVVLLAVSISILNPPA